MSGIDYIYDFMNRLCIHSITNKPWNLDTLIEKYTGSGIPALTIWEDAVKELGRQKRRGQTGEIRAYTSFPIARGGFFPDLNAGKRLEKIDHNKRMLEEASLLGAPLLVLVCGADPGQSLEHSRDQIRSGIETLVPVAADFGVKLAIEPLHPMYADTRSAINNLAVANDMAEYFESEWVGIAIDVYHLVVGPGTERPDTKVWEEWKYSGISYLRLENTD